MPAVHNCNALLSLQCQKCLLFSYYPQQLFLWMASKLARLQMHLHGNHTRVAFSIFLIFNSLGSGKCFDGSFCLFHATALELYHNFSFAAQLQSIFKLLNDAALSTREWHFRTVIAIKGSFRQIKLLVWGVWVLIFC